MTENFKIISILDRHSIAIKISEDEVKKLKIHLGSKVYIVAKKIEIKDPNTQEVLGNYTFYKDCLEVSEIFKKFIVATKYTEENLSPISFGVKSEVGNINVNKPQYDENRSDNSTIKIGDSVIFSRE